MEIVAVAVSITSLIVILYILKKDREYSRAIVAELKTLDTRIKDREESINYLSSRLSLIIRMLRQHMKDGEVLVQIGTANDRKLINALQAAGIYVQFDEFPQTELGRSKVIAEMLRGEDHG